MLSFGIPQGSILGPIIFNLYSNDLQDTLNSDALQYADDTTTYVSAKPKDLELAVIGTQSSLNNLDQWAYENNLTTNVIKTKYIFFSTKRMSTLHQLPEKNLNVTLANKNLKGYLRRKYLEFILMSI